MPENGVEIVGGLAQSYDPAMYKLPPVADWAVEAVPGANGGESPVLYSEALADLSVRQALIAVGDALVPANNGNDEVAKKLDLTRLSPEQIEEAMEGAEKIREEKDLPAEVRQPVLDFMKAAKNGNTAATEPSQSINSEQSSRARRRALKREEENRRREQLQDEHDAQRQSEFERLKDWRQENPSTGTNHLLEVEKLYETRIKPSGEIMVIETDEAAEQVSDFVKLIADNPQLLRTELEDSWRIISATQEMGIDIIEKVMRAAGEKAFQEWTDLAYEDPERIREVVPQWLQVFSEFGSAYKEAAKYDRNNVLLHRPNYNRDGGSADDTDDAVHNYGTQVLRTSLVRAAHTKPEEFLDLAYDMASEAIDTGDKFVAHSILRLLARISIYYPTANLMVVSTALVEDENHIARLKSMDLRKAMEENGCNIYAVDCHNVKKTKKPDKKIRNRFDRYESIARSLGLNPAEEKNLDVVFNEHLSPLMEEIESGGLPNSLYLRLRHDNANEVLPEDA